MWIAIHCFIWTIIFNQASFSIQENTIAGISLFFISLFLVPLFNKSRHIQTVLFCLQLFTAIVAFYPIHIELMPYLLIVHTLIIAEAVFHLSRLRSIIIIGVQLVSLSWLVGAAVIAPSDVLWYVIFNILIVIALLYYQAVQHRERELQRTNDALLHEYRKMKRQLVEEEEQTRQEERMLIGQEIHDSVGHKLTSLLMQMEAFRIQAAEPDKKTIHILKGLAEQSLEETRRAVKSFKQREVGGLQGVIRLIRKLEMESFMKINFSVKHGAFAAPLSGEQSFAIYRAVQEAMTNIMKHSSVREAQVMFESPGGSIFRFEVINQTTNQATFQEGYGLKAMRDRLEKVGGSLEIIQNNREFVVRGTILLVERGEQ